jgi:hypothetical protein
VAARPDIEALVVPVKLSQPKTVGAPDPPVRLTPSSEALVMPPKLAACAAARDIADTTANTAKTRPPL